MTVYIDVTYVLSVAFRSGIPRVVQEVVRRLLRRGAFAFRPVFFSTVFNAYRHVDAEKLRDVLDAGRQSAPGLLLPRTFTLDEVSPGDVFLDIDAVWHLSPRRSVVYPRLKRAGAKIVSYVYDIIPVTDPEFCHPNSVNNFLYYIGAVVEHADVILASTRSTLDEIAALQRSLNLPPTPSSATWLGADFVPAGENGSAEKIEDGVRTAVAAGRYILSVGTLQPLKNQSLLLDAFDRALFAKGLNLVLAGKVGWSVAALEGRIRNHPLLGKQLFFCEQPSDAAIDFLYRNAFCLAFPTRREGFGLPLVEALQRGTPVLASDIPVLREVGGDFCRYFSPDDADSFVSTVVPLIDAEGEYAGLREKVAGYKPVSWEDVAERMEASLQGLRPAFPYPLPRRIRQIVILSARVEDLLATLPFIERFMPFIEEAVICCPDAMEAPLKAAYRGRLALNCLADSQVLGGRPLPDDHATRNLFLRCLAVRRPEIDDVFIMSDDDYRPIRLLSEGDFLSGGKYKVRYCHRLEEWRGWQFAPTSFDRSMYNTAAFLRDRGLPTWMYDSHSPQVIDKRVFVEMLDALPGVEGADISDWSVYQNYFNARYGTVVENLPCATLAWPERPEMWEMRVNPDDYLFENYYAASYAPGGLFEGLSPEFGENAAVEGVMKVARYAKAVAENREARAMFAAYRETYHAVFGEYPALWLSLGEEKMALSLPRFLAIRENHHIFVPVAIVSGGTAPGSFEVSWRAWLPDGSLAAAVGRMEVRLPRDEFALLLKLPFGGVNLKFEVSVFHEGRSCAARSVLRVMRPLAGGASETVL